MSAPKKTRINLYGYEVLRVPGQPVDPVLDGKDKPMTKNKSNAGAIVMKSSLFAIVYILLMIVAGFHSYRAYATNEQFDLIHRVFFAVLFAPLYILYVIVKTNTHALFGLAKGADLISMSGKPYYLHS
jgi:Ca2+/H+ antiporter